MKLNTVLLVVAAFIVYQTKACTIVYNATSQMQEITTTGYPNSRTTPSCDWIIRASSPSKSVYINFVDYSNHVYDTMEVLDGPHVIAEIAKSGGNMKMVVNNQTAVIRHRRTIREFKRSLQTYGVSLRLQYMEVERCGSTETLAGNFTSPSFPDFAPPNAKCNWNLRLTSQSISRVLELILHKTGSGTDLIEVYSLSAKMGSVTDNSSFYHPSFLRVYMETGTKETSAVKFDAQFNVTDCNWNLLARDNEEVLTSLGYPNSKDLGYLNCIWTIKPSTAGKSIHIRLIHASGISGNLQIIASKANMTREVLFSHTGGIRTMQEHKNMNLVVHSPSAIIDLVGANDGFNLTYSQVDKCGFYSDVLNGTIVPQTMTPNAKCGWNLAKKVPADQTKVFQLAFGTVGRRGQGGSLQIYDKFGFLANLYEATYREFASDDILRVYYDPGSTDGLPFNATYTYQLCRRSLVATSTPQTATSPGFPLYKPRGIICDLSINPSTRNTSIRLQLSGNSLMNSYSSIKVTEGTSTIMQYGHNIISSKIYIVAHKFPVNINYNTLFGGAGYSLVYSEVPTCGFSTNATAGAISLPHNPHIGKSKLVCGWNLYNPLNFMEQVFAANSLQIDQRYDTFKAYYLTHEIPPVRDSPNQIFSAPTVLRFYFESANYSISNSRLFGQHSLRTCGGTFQANTTEQMLSPFGLPGMTVVGAYCTWTIKADPLMSINVNLQHYRIGNTGGRFLVKGIADYSKDINNQSILVHSQSVFISMTGHGVTFTYAQVPRCGRDIFDLNGWFSSQEIPASNQSRVICSWNFIQYARYPMTLTFSVFNTSSDSTALTVYGSNLNPWGKVRTGETAVFYGSKPIRVFLELDQTKNERIYFNVTYKLEGPSDCRMRVNASEAQQFFTALSSTPQYYASGRSCRYTVTSASNATSLHVRVVELFPQSSDRVQIIGLDMPLGKKHDINIISHLSQFDIGFYVSRTTGQLPFQIKIKEVPTCGRANVLSTGQIISSPGFSDYSPRGLKCGWEYKPPNSKYLALKMLNFDLSPSDKLEIYTSTDRFYNASQFLFTTLPFIETMRIYYETSAQPGQSRFSANISTQTANKTDCGGNLPASSQWQRLTSRGYPYTYLSFLSCSWNIRPQQLNKVIQVTAMDINLPNIYLNFMDERGNFLTSLTGIRKDVKLFFNSSVTVTFSTYASAKGGFYLRYREGNDNTCLNSVCHKTLATCTPNSDNTAYSCECLAGYEGNGTICNPFCPNSTILDYGSWSSYNFERASLDETMLSTDKCPDGRSIASAECRRNPSNSTAALFTNIHSLPCTKNLTAVTSEISKQPVTTETVATSLTNLKLLTSSPDTNLTLTETAAVTGTLLLLTTGNPSTVKITKQNLLDTLLVTNQVSNSLSYDETNDKKIQDQKTTLVKVLEDFTDRVELPENKTSLTLITKGITVQVEEQKPVDGHYSDVSFSPVSSTGAVYDPPISFVIPAELLELAAEGFEYDRRRRSVPQKPVRVSFTLHKTNALFPQSEDEISEVITARIRNYSVSTTNETVNITFNNRTKRQGSVPHESNELKETVTRTQCVSFDKEDFRWIPNTCRLVSGPDGDPKFHCHQLGHFAMIVKSVVLPSAHALHIATYIGCGLSMAGLVLTFIIYCSVKALRVKKPTLFLLNICVCLLAVNVIFLTSAGNVEDRVGCYISTAFLQYFLLATWFWMSANAYDLYNALVKVISTSSERVRATSVLVSYLIPMVIVLTNACVTILYYDIPRYRPDDNLFVSSYQARHMCWVHLSSLHYGFLLPIGLLLVFNIILFGIVFSSLTCRKQQIRSSAQKRTGSQDFMLAITLILMMGLTWIFGFLMLLADDVTYQSIMAWLFTVVNSLQGFFIFLSNCVRNPSVRSVWLHPILRALGCGRCVGSSATTISSSRAGSADTGKTRASANKQSEASQSVM